MRRAILALAVALVAIFATQGAAAADYAPERSAESCHGHEVCLIVWWQRDQDNTGFKLNQVKIECNNALAIPGDRCWGVDGDVLKCYNQDGDIKWQKFGSDINLGRDDSHYWAPLQTWGQATELTCKYTGDWHDALGYHENFVDIVDRT